VNTSDELEELRPAYRSDRFELFAAVLLGIATLLTAYGAMRSAIVGDEVLEGFTLSSQYYAEASAVDDQNTQTFVADQNLFLRYAEATFSRNNGLADYLRKSLFSDQLETATVWWEGQRTAADPPESPFHDGSPYKFDTDAQPLITKAEANFDAGKRADARNDRFDQATAILSITLFTGAVATLIRSRKARHAFVALALAGIALGITFIAVGEFT
jgi:hypothetical protein